MKKSNLFQNTLEREMQDQLAPYPDPIGRTDFCKACRIGTRTSIYLLQSGLAEPTYYTPPSGWYKNYPNHKPPAFGLNGAPLVHRGPAQSLFPPARL